MDYLWESVKDLCFMVWFRLKLNKGLTSTWCNVYTHFSISAVLTPDKFNIWHVELLRQIIRAYRRHFDTVLYRSTWKIQHIVQNLTIYVCESLVREKLSSILHFKYIILHLKKYPSELLFFKTLYWLQWFRECDLSWQELVGVTLFTCLA